MFKRTLALFMLISFCAAFCSCSLSPADVKLFDAEECKKYVEENYFPCELISEDKQENCNIYTFKDPELDLTFTVKCQPSGQGMDGTAFYYKQGVSCNYDEVYYSYVADSIKDKADELCEEYGMKIEWKERVYREFCVVYFDSKDTAKCRSAVTELGQAIADADTRSRFSDCEIYCVGGVSFIGKFYFKDMIFLEPGSEMDEYNNRDIY